MTTSFLKLQVRLTDLLRRSEEDDDFWQTRAVELKNTIQETLQKSQSLSDQNAELERRIAQQKPEMDKAIDARLATVRKLRNVYRVVVDLADKIDEINEKQLTDEEIREVITDAYAAEGSLSASDSDATIDGRGRRQNEQTTEIAKSRPPSRVEDPHTPTRSSVADELSTGPTNSSTGSSSLSVHAAGSENPLAAEGPWQIQYSKIPGSSELSCGPVSPNRIVKHLEGRQDLHESLQRLELQDDFGLRVHIEGRFAFVYDPIFLEASTQTVLLDWGSDSVNEDTAKYITQDAVFHTFVFPMQKNKWFYVGAHTWNIIDVLPTWPELGRKSRSKIVKKLRERCHGNIEEEEIIRRLDSKELSQICIQISSTSHWEISQGLARKMGFERRRVQVIRGEQTTA